MRKEWLNFMNGMGLWLKRFSLFRVFIFIFLPFMEVASYDFQPKNHPANTDTLSATSLYSIHSKSSQTPSVSEPLVFDIEENQTGHHFRLPTLEALNFSEEELSNFFEKEAEVPLFLELNFKSPCQANCLYCFTESASETKQYTVRDIENKTVSLNQSPLNRNEMKEAIRQYAKLGGKVLFICSEGEPLLRTEEFFDYAETAKSEGIRVIVFTNMLAITREVARRLNDAQVNIVCKIESLDPRKNNSIIVPESKPYQYVHYRGAEIPEPLYFLLEAYKDSPGRLALGSTLTNINREDLLSIRKYAYEELGLAHFIKKVHWNGFAEKNRERLEVPEAERTEFDQTLYSFDHEHGYFYPTGLREEFSYDIRRFLNNASNKKGFPLKIITNLNGAFYTDGDFVVSVRNPDSGRIDLKAMFDKVTANGRKVVKERTLDSYGHIDKYIQEKLTTSSYSIFLEDQKRGLQILNSLSRGILPEQFPFQLQLDLTVQCNYWDKNPKPEDCIGCSYPNKEAKEADIRSVLDLLMKFEAQGGESVLITGGGEPGMYRQLDKVLEFFAGSELSIGMNTNGLVADRLEKSDESVLKRVFGKKNPSIISVSIHDHDSYKGLDKLNTIRKKLGLNLLLRATFLVHDHTTVADIEQFIEMSQNCGADMAVVKPYHVFRNGYRRFEHNQQVYEYLKQLTSSKDKKFKIETGVMRLDRISNEFTKEEEKMQNLVEKDPEKFINLAPLLAIYSNVELKPAMNCDAKDFGVGGTSPDFLADQIPRTPQDYFIKALCGIVMCKERNYILGDNFTEINQAITQDENYLHLIDELKFLRILYLGGKLQPGEIEKYLRNMFSENERFQGPFTIPSAVETSL